MTARWMALSMLVCGAAGAAEPKEKGTATEGVIDPKADHELHRMSDYLSGLKSVRTNTTTVDEKVTKDGQKIQELQQSKITVQRPGEMRVDRVGPNGHSVFVDDGKSFGVANREKNVYATAPAPPDLDAAIDAARQRLHVDAPGGDLFVKDPYKELIDGTVTGRYIGLEPVDGAMAHHLAFTKKNIDWQIWIKDGPDAVPLRYVITSKDLPGSPQFTLETHEWQANVSASPAEFKFTPPPGAKKVEFAAPKKTGE